MLAGQIPKELKYTEDHLWAKVNNNKITIGITPNLADDMEDALYVSLPEEDTQVEVGSKICMIEFNKGVHHVVSPVEGIITEVNADLEGSPEQINDDPYGEGWIVVIEPLEVSDIAALLDDFEYEEFIEDL